MADLPDLANPHYLACVNRAIDHITSHLDHDLALEEVARVAGFSPFHFHRVFRSVIGETLHDFVKRELALAGPIDLELRAIDWLYATYLPRSSYVPAEQPLFEAWDGEPFAHGAEHFTLRLQLAVVEAR